MDKRNNYPEKKGRSIFLVGAKIAQALVCQEFFRSGSTKIARGKLDKSGKTIHKELDKKFIFTKVKNVDRKDMNIVSLDVSRQPYREVRTDKIYPRKDVIKVNQEIISRSDRSKTRRKTMYTIKGANRVDRPVSEGGEGENRNQAGEGGWLSSEGPFVQRLETEFAARVGREYALGVRDGATALALAIASTGIGRGDEVILPTFTSVAAATAIARTGALAVLIDSDPRAWNPDVSRIEARITPKTKAILVSHTYGFPVEMTPVLQLAEKYGLWAIEDAAAMHGQTYAGRPCGSFGHLATFSFYRDKLVTAGEGGIIVTDNATLADRCRELRDLSARSATVFSQGETDGNARMNNLQAALGFAYLERLEEFIARKRQIGQLYTELLADAPGLQLPLSESDRADNCYSVYGLVLLEGVPLDAREMMKRLAEQGIETRPFFRPLHEQPEFQETIVSWGESFPVAERLFRRGFKIPGGMGLKDEQIARVATVIKQILSS